MPARTVSRVLARRGAPRLAALDPLSGQVIRASKTTATRYERARHDERAAALAPWIEHCNTRRRHSALGGLPPISRLSPT